MRNKYNFMNTYSTAILIPTFPEAQALFKISKTKLLYSSDTFWIYEIIPDNQSPQTLLIVCGMGQELAKTALTYLLNHYSIQQVCLLGFCGALKDNLKRPKAFIITESKNLKNQTLLTPSPLPEKTRSLSKAIAVTVNSVAGQKGEKLLLQENYLADIVEMESFALAELCQQKQIPFLHLRWVLDEFNDTIPNVSAFVDAWGKIKILPLVFSLLKNPALCFELILLGKNSKQSLEAMLLYLKTFLESLYEKQS